MAIGRLVLIVFLVFQAADGLITYQFVTIFGPTAEANVLLAAWISAVGPGAALLGAKLMACGCGMVLYTCQAHRALAGLTGLYLWGAVLPWLHLLSVLPLA